MGRTSVPSTVRRVAAALAVVLVPIATALAAPPLASATVSAPAVTSVTPNIGLSAGGATVTLEGSGFTGATAVTFGGSPSTSFTVVSDGEISVVTPPHPAAKVAVVVDAPGGASAVTMSDLFTYEGPYVTKVAPYLLSTGGGTISVTGSGFAGVTGVHIGTTSALGVTPVSFTRVTNMVVSVGVPPLPAGTYDVTVTTPVGTSPDVRADHLEVIVPVLNQVMPTSGVANKSEAVELNGAALSGATAVDFGSVAATFVVRGINAITAVAPPEAAGKVAVTVTTSAGVTAVGAHDWFTYRGPTVTHVTPTSGSANGGTSVLIQGSLFAGLSAVTFGGVAATSYVLQPTGTIMAVSPPHAAGSVDVQVTANAGTSVPAATDHFTYVG